MSDGAMDTPTSVDPPLVPVRPVRDDDAMATVRQVEFVSSCVTLGVAALCLIPVIRAFFSGLASVGTGYGLLNGVLMLVLMAMVYMVGNGLLQRLVVAPYRAVRYGAVQKRMANVPATLGLHPGVLRQWRLPAPGLLALDSTRGLLFVNMRATNYHGLLLTGNDIIGAKVERESEVHTQTTHGGSLGVFSRIGVGYSFGSTSKSKSVVIERAFLEVHFQQPTATAPGWIAIPYGADRRDADSMAAAINRLRPSA